MHLMAISVGLFVGTPVKGGSVVLGVKVGVVDGAGVVGVMGDALGDTVGEIVGNFVGTACVVQRGSSFKNDLDKMSLTFPSTCPKNLQCSYA